MADEGGHDHGRTSAVLRPGALSALLQELAAAPPSGAEARDWEEGIGSGESVGRFEIVREIGRGGFGVVYEARDMELGRSVAFKAIRRRSSDAAREQRALAEAEAAARLAHPNIVHLYDVGHCERGAFLIMELLRGESLDERLERGPPLELRDAVHIAAEIARGVAHAHEQGVVHRDLKPGNVFLCDDGQVKVLDFGLAHVFGRGGASGGTPAYMAPEQARGEPSDERADVFALGVIAHELVTGKRPFDEGEPGAREGGEAPELPGAPAALAKLVARMLEREPAARPSSGVAVRDQLLLVRRSLEPRRLFWVAWGLAAAAFVAAGALALRTRPLPPGRLLAAMPDVVNATGDPDLGGVGDLVRVGLEQSRRLSIVARSRMVNVLRQGGDPVPEVIDERLARTAAQRIQAQVLLVPAVREIGASLEVSLRAVDLARGEPAFVVRESAPGKGSVPQALERLVTRVRESLREQPGDAMGAHTALFDVAPANPEALRHYAAGQRLQSRADLGGAVEEWERAVAADPDFPLPRVELALWYEQRDYAKAKGHIEAARRTIDRLPPKERGIVEGVAAFYDDGTHTELIQRLDRSVTEWPEEPRPYRWLFNMMLGRGDAEAARAYAEKALAVAATADDDAVDYLLLLGRTDEALARARHAVAEAPNDWSFVILSMVHRVRGETEQALEAARRALSYPLPGGNPAAVRVYVPAFADADALDELEEVFARGTGWAARPAAPNVKPLPPNLYSRIKWLALQGRWQRALKLLDARAPRPGAPAEMRANYHLLRSQLLAYSGARPDDVWREVEEQFRCGSVLIYENIIRLVLVGDLERASLLMDSWLFPDHNVIARLHRHLQAWKRGDREGALRGLAGVFGWQSEFYRGSILQELGRDREAVEEFRKFRRTDLIVFPDFDEFFAFYPRSMYLEAVSLDRLGDRDAARTLLDRLLRMWRQADRGSPMLREAKALKARLDREGTP